MASNNNRYRSKQLTLTGITVHFKDSKPLSLDLGKVKIVDKETSKDLFYEETPPTE